MGQRNAFSKVPGFSTDTAETTPSIIHQLSQPEAKVRTNPCQKERPHLTMRFRSAGQSAGDTVSRDCYPTL